MIDELKNVKPSDSFISEGCLSFVDESTFAIAAIDEEFDELMEACGAGSDNAPEVEAGKEDSTNESTEVVNEAIDLKKIGGQIVEFIQGIWAKIKEAFGKVTEWIQKKVLELKNKGLDKFVFPKLDNAEFKSTDKFGKFHPNKNIGTTKWMKVFEDASIGVDTENEKLDTLPAQIASAVAVGGKVKVTRMDVKTMRQMMRDAFLGADVEITGTNFAQHKEEIKNIAKGGLLSDIKTQYNESRKLINEMIAEFKKEAKAADSKDAKKEKLAGANVARRMGQLLFTGHMVQFDAMRTQMNEAIGICVRIAYKIKKKEEKVKDKKEPVNAAAEIFAW